MQKLYPGGNVQQIGLQQRALEEAWTTLRCAADERRHSLHQHLLLHQFLTQVSCILFNMRSMKDVKIEIFIFLLYRPRLCTK